jgi:hypothetical protein
MIVFSFVYTKYVLHPQGKLGVMLLRSTPIDSRLYITRNDCG